MSLANIATEAVQKVAEALKPAPLATEAEV